MKPKRDHCHGHTPHLQKGSHTTNTKGAKAPNSGVEQNTICYINIPLRTAFPFSLFSRQVFVNRMLCNSVWAIYRSLGTANSGCSLCISVGVCFVVVIVVCLLFFCFVLVWLGLFVVVCLFFVLYVCVWFCCCCCCLFFFCCLFVCCCCFFCF